MVFYLRCVSRCRRLSARSFSIRKTAPPPYSAEPSYGQPQPPIGFNYNSMNNPAQPPYGQAPQQGGTNVVMIESVPRSTVIIVNACPNCRNGILMGHFPCLAIFFAIFFFPLGFLCCMLMKVHTCNSCGYTM